MTDKYKIEVRQIAIDALKAIGVDPTEANIRFATEEMRVMLKDLAKEFTSEGA